MFAWVLKHHIFALNVYNHALLFMNINNGERID